MRDYLLRENPESMLQKGFDDAFEPAADHEEDTLVGILVSTPRMAIRGLFEAIRECGQAALLERYGLADHIVENWTHRDGPCPLPMVPRIDGRGGPSGYAHGLRTLIEGLTTALNELVLGPAKNLGLKT